MPCSVLQQPPAPVLALQLGLRLLLNSPSAQLCRSWSGCLAEGTESTVPVSHSTAEDALTGYSVADEWLNCCGFVETTRLAIGSENAISKHWKPSDPAASPQLAASPQMGDPDEESEVASGSAGCGTPAGSSGNMPYCVLSKSSVGSHALSPPGPLGTVVGCFLTF